MAKKKNKGIFLKLAIFTVLALFLSTVLAKTNFFKAQIECANSISCIKDLSGRYDPNPGKSIFLGQVINPPQELAQAQENSVLGETTGANKHIYVDLSQQHLYAYEGDKIAFDFPISSGKWRPTPTGDFKIWIKLRYTRMTGGEGADFYDLPNVPYVMFFYNSDVPQAAGFSLHGAYWHNNFGHPMSHGCVNISPLNAEKLYNWASPTATGNSTYATSEDPGTIVTIYGTAPNE